MPGDNPVRIVRFELRGSCIRTAAMREYRGLADDLLKGRIPADSDEGAAYEVLRRFLQESDFTRIRASDPELAGGTDVEVELRMDPDGKVSIRKVGPRSTVGVRRAPNR